MFAFDCVLIMTWDIKKNPSKKQYNYVKACRKVFMHLQNVDNIRASGRPRKHIPGLTN